MSTSKRSPPQGPTDEPIDLRLACRQLARWDPRPPPDGVIGKVFQVTESARTEVRASRLYTAACRAAREGLLDSDGATVDRHDFEAWAWDAGYSREWDLLERDWGLLEVSIRDETAELPPNEATAPSPATAPEATSATERGVLAAGAVQGAAGEAAPPTWADIDEVGRAMLRKLDEEGCRLTLDALAPALPPGLRRCTKRLGTRAQKLAAAGLIDYTRAGALILPAGRAYVRRL